MRFVDLSATIAPSPPTTPDPVRTEIAYQNHTEGATQIQGLFGVPSHLLRNGEGWSTETFTRFGTHDSTHVDAPSHYNTTIQGQPAATIDQLPLNWFFSNGVMLDMTAKADAEAVQAGDVQAELARLKYTLQPLDIVLIRTGRDAYYQAPDYIFRGPGVSREATLWLYEQGVRVMGIDAWGWDVPLNVQAQQALSRQETDVFWSAHQADIPYCQIERLVNLASLPPIGFQVVCFPLKIQGGSAGPARVVALLPD